MNKNPELTYFIYLYVFLLPSLFLQSSKPLLLLRSCMPQPPLTQVFLYLLYRADLSLYTLSRICPDHIRRYTCRISLPQIFCVFCTGIKLSAGQDSREIHTGM